MQQETGSGKIGRRASEGTTLQGIGRMWGSVPMAVSLRAGTVEVGSVSGTGKAVR